MQIRQTRFGDYFIGENKSSKICAKDGNNLYKALKRHFLAGSQYHSRFTSNIIKLQCFNNFNFRLSWRMGSRRITQVPRSRDLSKVWTRDQRWK